MESNKLLMNFSTQLSSKSLNYSSLLRLLGNISLIFCLAFGLQTNVEAKNFPLESSYNIGLSTNSMAELGVLVVSQPSYATCSTAENGDLSAIGFNGVPPYSYEWSNGATTVDIDGLGVGTYTVTITDSDGATAEASGDITLHPEGVWIMISATGACNDQNNGTAYASAMLGTEPYSYEWSNGQTGPDATGLSQGLYTVTATDAFGCSNEESIFIQGGLNVDVFLTSTYETCAGSEDAKITAIVSGGQEPYSYEWSDGQTTQIATGLGAGDYSLTVTDNLGCSTVATETVELSPEGLWIMLSSTDANCGQENGTIHVGVMTGVPPYDFEWNDASIGNTGDPIDLAAGNYQVTVSDANGCTAVESIDVNSTDQINLTTTSVNATCDSGGSATVIINNGAGPFNILWCNDANTESVSNLPPGICTVEVSDANGCFGTATVLIGNDCNPCDAEAGTLEPDASPDCVSGSTTISATPNGNASVPAGFETIFVLTSGNGLVIQAVNSSPSFDVSAGGIYTIHTLVYDPTTLDLSIVDFGVTTGFDVNALLQQGGGDICASLDVAGASFNLDDGFAVNIVPQDASICAGGSVQLSTTLTSNAISYEWTNNGGTFDNPNSDSPTYTMMMPGTYEISVTATDPNTGCSGTATTTVTVIENPTISISPEDQSLCGGGSLNFTASGVPNNSSYEWSATGGSFDNPMSGAPTWTMMMPGTYTISLTITTPEGCSATASTNATINANPTDCSASVTSSYFEGVAISTRGGSDGTASASASGAGPFTYLWDNGQTTQEATGLSAGTYTVEITNPAGCSCNASVTLEDPAKLGNLAWIDSNRNGVQDPGESGIEGVKATLTVPGTYKVTFDTPMGYVPTDANQGTDDALDSDADPITGMTQMVDLAAGDYDPTLDAGFYECANIGDFVWRDYNQNGIQDPGEEGVEGITVKLLLSGPDDEFCTPDDIVWREVTTGPNGEYLFECVEPSTYVISFMDLPTDWIFTGQDAGSDDEDSDADPSTGKTAPFTVTSGMPDDLTFDAGIRPQCDNFTSNGGEIINSDEVICIGETPQAFINITTPTGGSGPIEYLWLFTTSPGPWMPPLGFTEIPNSNSLTYQPGPLTETTTFLRCARRAGCPDYLESNWFTIEVENCTTSPIQSNVTLGGTLNANDQTVLDWSMENEVEGYNFIIEKSYDGVKFFDLASTLAKGSLGETKEYLFEDNNTKKGMNFYRIRTEGSPFGPALSNVIELEVSTEILVQAFPNPFVDRLILTPDQKLQDDLLVEIYTTGGQLIYSNSFDKSTEIVEIEVSEKEFDLRTLILRMSHPNNKKQKVMRVIQISK